jgi:hypothetical protein
MGPEASGSSGDPKGAEMQNAVAEQRVQDNALSGTTTISLRDTGPAGPKPARPEIEVIPEVSGVPGPISEADAVFCRDLLEFLGDFKSVAPKSSTVRRLGQAAVQNEPVARDLAPHQDLLFDFLRAYEAAPKMRPLSQRSLASGTPEAVAKGPGQIAATPTVAEPEDTPFRVPPYVSSVSENTGTEEALLDPDAEWLEPQDSPEPVADRPVAMPVAMPVAVPAAMVVAETAAPAPLAQRPARAPAAKQPSPVPVAKRPEVVPVSKRPDPVPVAKRPAPAALAKRPDSMPVPPRPAPVAAAPSPAPVVVAPSPAPVVVAPSPAPVVVAPSPAPVVVAPSPAPAAVVRKPDAKPAPAQAKKRPEPRPAAAPAVKPLGPAAARAKAIAEGLIV